MTLIDARSQLLIYAMFSAVCLIVMTSLWLQNRKRSPEITLWLVDYVLQFSALLLITFRGIVPDLASIVLAHTLIIGGTVVLYRGLEHFLGKESRQLHNYVMVTLFTLVVAYLTFVNPSPALRNVNLSLGLLYISAQVSWLMLRRVGDKLRPAARATGVVFAGFSLLSIAHVLVNLLVPQANNLFKSGLISSMMILAYQILFVSLTFTLMLLVSRRLLTGLERELVERKQAEEAVKTSEEQVRLLLDSTAEAIYGIDLKGDCTFANPSCIRMLGYAGPEQLFGKNVHGLIHHSYPDGAQMAIEDCRIYRAFREGKGEHADDEVLWRADGTSFPVEYWSYPQIVNSEVCGAVVTFLDITKRKQAQEALRESRQRFQGLVETLYDWVWEVDSQGRYTYVSPQIKNILGYEQQEVLGKTPYDLMLPDEAKRVSDLFGALIREQKPITTLENINIHKDGHLVALETNGLPFYDADGNLKGYRGTDRDITARKEAEEELRQSEEKFFKAFQTSPHAIVISRLKDGKFVEVNDAFVSLTGFSRAEIAVETAIGLKLWVHEKDREDIVSALREGRPVVGRELLFRKKNGEVLTGMFSSQALQLSQGLCILSSFDDITERKRVEEDLRRNRRFLSDLIEHSGALICVKDRDGRYQLVNRKWEEVTGRIRQDALGRKVEDLFPGAAGRQFRLNDLAVMESGHALEKEETLENEHGKRFFLSIKFPLLDDAGVIEGVCEMSSEITERKQTEQALAAERQRLSYILEGTNVGTWEWNVQTGETIFNERWAEIVGYTLAELAPVSIDTWLKLTHPDDLKMSEDLLQEHFRKELPYYDCEARMRHKDGTWVWVHDRGKVVTWTDDGKPLMVSGTHQDITKRKQAEEKIHHLATHDGLTGLPSLRLARDRLSTALSRSRRHKDLTAVMFIDLDGFKAVNDSLGHDAGDSVLKQVSHRLLSCVRATDTVARVGGDEFLLIATELHSSEDAAMIAEKTVHTVSRPLILDGRQAVVGASIGIALFPDHGEDIEQLIRQADAAMYRTKNTGKNGFSFARTVTKSSPGTDYRQKEKTTRYELSAS